MRDVGHDPAARAGELHALAALEGSDQRVAQDRFHELKRAILLQRRSELIAELARHGCARDLPPHDAQGYALREVESELRRLQRAVAQARSIAEARAEEADARAKLRHRPAPDAMAIDAAPWDQLAPLDEAAAGARRATLRELRIETRALDARRRAAKLGALRVDAPEPETATDDALDEAERALAAAEALVAAHAAATAPLRDAAVREWTRESRRALEQECDAALAARDQDALARLRERAEELRRVAASKAEAAARARRRGHAAPERERRRGDPIDPYG